MTCITEFTTVVVGESGETRVSALCPEIRKTARRLVDSWGVCGERLACHHCDTCERRLCQACVLPSLALPLSRFCSTECRDEAELAAEQARQTDICGR